MFSAFYELRVHQFSYHFCYGFLNNFHRLVKSYPALLSLNNVVNMSKKLKQSPQLCTLKSFERIPATGVKANLIKISMSIIVNRT